MTTPCDDLLHEVESIYYWYLSSLNHVATEHKTQKSILNGILSKFEKISPALVTTEAIYQNHLVRIRDYNRPSGSDILHEVPQAQIIVDSAPGGRFECLLGSSLVQESYQLWEEKYRIRIAESIGTDKDSIKSIFWGEARRYRNAIAHDHGIGNKHTEACTLLPASPTGHKIIFSAEFIIKYMDLCKQSITEIKNEYKRA